jgi:hypothetical protein
VPYIADHLWQDVLAAARKIIPAALESDLNDDKLPGLADKLAAALEATESSTTEAP